MRNVFITGAGKNEVKTPVTEGIPVAHRTGWQGCDWAVPLSAGNRKNTSCSRNRLFRFKEFP
ncbi:hypothetical protein CSA37_09430 [Candidatus Fermentibacteria bacterium]|nr:MAG: hypothetical protein CSA37_09430 [Candidatus Fermentibacteria bacterium]